MEQKIAQISEMIELLLSDNSVPKNIRKTLSDAQARLKSKDDINVRVSAAVYLIESVSEDINMPAHARTQLWGIISALEFLKI